MSESENNTEFEYDNSPASHDSFRTQLEQLNIRSRWYSELIGWKLPFAYIAGTGIFIGFFKNLYSYKNQYDISLILAFIFSGAIGILIIRHMRGIRVRRDKAVRHMQYIENKLKLPRASEISGKISRPILFTMIILIAVYFLSAVALIAIPNIINDKETDEYNKLVFISLPEQPDKVSDTDKVNKEPESKVVKLKLISLFTDLLSNYIEDKGIAVKLATTLAEDFLSSFLSESGTQLSSALFDWLRSSSTLEKDIINDYVVRFEFKDYEIPISGYKLIEKLKDVIKEKEYSQIIITGYADRVGSEDSNSKLAYERAVKVSNLLSQQGFIKSKIAVVSKGENELPISTPNEIREPENRRVTIQIK